MCSCYRRLRFLGSGRRRDLFLKVLEDLRIKHDFIVAGYVVMPEHFHLLVTEPKRVKLSVMMQVLKQRVSRLSRQNKANSNQMPLWKVHVPRAFWQKRYYDFNVYSQRKYVEKLRYMHRNPVKRGLVTSPELWRWSSLRRYYFGESGAVKIGE
jgi:putative transposase